MLRIERRDRAKHLELFIMDVIRMHASRRLHRQKSYDLQHVVLNHIPNGSCRIVEVAATLDTEFFRHCDLHALDVVAIPNRLQKTVREPEEQQIQDSFLHEKMKNVEKRGLRKHRAKCCVQLLCRCEIVSERLLHYHSRIFQTARVRE